MTTFSIANDVAKYFAIIPALFMGLFPGLAALNIMQLHSAESAIFSAIIYNALIIIALIPLALKGVKIQGSVGWQTVVQKPFNLWYWGYHSAVCYHKTD